MVTPTDPKSANQSKWSGATIAYIIAAIVIIIGAYLLFANNATTPTTTPPVTENAPAPAPDATTPTPAPQHRQPRNRQLRRPLLRPRLQRPSSTTTCLMARQFPLPRQSPRQRKSLRPTGAFLYQAFGFFFAWVSFTRNRTIFVTRS